MPNSGSPQNDVTLLRSAIVAQGARVLDAITLAFDLVMGHAAMDASRLRELEDEIDRRDVEIERQAVGTLARAAREGSALDEPAVRTILMIVKINNELERIADLGVDVVDRSERLRSDVQDLPLTLRVMTNSAIGIVRDANRAVELSDPGLANIVLKCEDAMEAFRAEVLRNAERELAGGTISLELTLFMHSVAARCVQVADHCTNIAEQVIYAETGKIVRHTTVGWIDVTQDRS